MQLKKLEAFGFKSFADRASFEFGPGITAFVGPNGCGKSNIVDAIRWVLGEQSAKSLRGSQMQDVIFNGTDKRHQLGYAEVSLTIDNSERTLPVDFAEVCVSRRLFRTGESEYLVNRQPARLRDIKEMFLDTGVGMDCYSVIEQGNVEQLVNSNPMDRRLVFEEAAGISKYKQQKKQAVSKLERTEQNLLRLNDIIEEVQRQLRSVKLQAAKARRYKEHADRLRQLRVALSLYNFRQLSAKQGDAERLLKDLEQKSGDLESRRRQLETGREQLETLIEEVDADSAQAQSELSALDLRLSNARHDLETNRRRISELDEEAGTQKQRISEFNGRVQQLDSELQEARKELDKVKARIDSLSADADSRNVELEQVEYEIDRLTQEAEDKKSQVLQLLQQESFLQNQLGTLSSRRSELEARRTREEQAISDREATIRQMDEQAEALREKISALTRTAEELSADRQSKSAKAVELADAIEGLAAEESRLRAELRGKQSEAQVLQDLERRREGVEAGVCAILEAAEGEDAIQGVHGMVADVISVSAENAVAVEAAIGDHAQSIVIDQASVAAKAIDQLHEARTGRAAFLPLDMLHTPEADRPEGLPEGAVPAVEAVEYPDQMRPVVDYLLGDTWIVDELDAALLCAQNGCPPGIRLVSRRGDLVESKGTLSGGESSRLGLISRKSELARLAEETAAIQKSVAGLETERHASATALEGLKSEIGALQDSIQTNLVNTTAAKGELASLEQQSRQITEEQELARAEVAEIDREIEETNKREGDLQSRLAQAQEKRKAVQQEIADVGQALKQKGDERTEISARLSDLRQELARIQTKRDGTAELIGRIEQDRAEAENDLQDIIRQGDLNSRRRSEAEERIREAEEFCSEHEGMRRGLEEKIEALRAKREATRSKVEETRRSESSLREKEEELQQESEGARLQRIECSTRMDDLQDRILEDYRIWLPALDVDAEQLDSPETWPEEPAEPEQPEQGIPQDEAEAETRPEAETQIEAGRDENAEAPEAPAEEAAPVSVKEETLKHREAILEIADLPDANWSEIEAETRQLKAKIDRIGSVNLDAIRQQEELEERESFLLNQKEDLETSRQSLQDIIRKINHTSRELFSKTFEQVKENFSVLFRKLFGGGKAELVLQEGVDVLEAGIEIIARPPGKEPKSLSLLSGGEKVMTTVALLFAIFKTRPSPFCLLDEVDAALDESNIGRFVVLLSEYAKESQFLIITHSKRTMSIADVLYGITQEELGVTKCVKVDFEEVDQHLREPSAPPRRQRIEAEKVPAAE